MQNTLSQAFPSTRHSPRPTGIISKSSPSANLQPRNGGRRRPANCTIPKAEHSSPRHLPQRDTRRIRDLDRLDTPAAPRPLRCRRQLEKSNGTGIRLRSKTLRCKSVGFAAPTFRPTLSLALLHLLLPDPHRPNNSCRQPSDWRRVTGSRTDDSR